MHRDEATGWCASGSKRSMYPAGGRCNSQRTHRKKGWAPKPKMGSQLGQGEGTVGSKSCEHEGPGILWPKWLLAPFP